MLMLVLLFRKAFASWRDKLPENRFLAVSVWKVDEDEDYLQMIPPRNRKAEWKLCLKRRYWLLATNVNQCYEILIFIFSFRVDYLVLRRRSVWLHVGHGQHLPEHDLELDDDGFVPTQIPHADRFASDNKFM